MYSSKKETKFKSSETEPTCLENADWVVCGMGGAVKKRMTLRIWA